MQAHSHNWVALLKLPGFYYLEKSLVVVLVNTELNSVLKGILGGAIEGLQEEKCDNFMAQTRLHNSNCTHFFLSSHLLSVLQLFLSEVKGLMSGIITIQNENCFFCFSVAFSHK